MPPNLSMMSILRRFLPLLVLAAIGLAIYLGAKHFSTFRFEGWNGPQEESRMEAAVDADMSRYSKGGKHALAVLVTDTASDWLGLAHGLKTIGVPFVLTREVEQALTHRMVLVYPAMSGKLLSGDALRALAAHPRNGGTLVGFEILGGGMNEVFGFGEFSASRGRKSMRFATASLGTSALPDADDVEVSLSGPSGGVPSYAFSPTTGTPAALYDDGLAAVVQREHAGGGKAVAFGIDLGAYIAKAYNGRQDLGRQYINAYEPGVDTFLRILRGMYRAAEPMAVTLDTVPFGKSASVIITHDVDYTRSIENAIRYAEFERAQGIAATYFIQTKYVRDWNDDIFFNERGAELTRRLAGMGMEIASHSVSHSRVFAAFPLGDGKERYPDYTPRVTGKQEARDASILGELRVSRFLLQQAAPGAAVESFRPGHLEYPFDLPQALQATGYRFSSSISSGTALSHLPFRLNHGRANSAETAVFEFPITIEDELQRPMTGRLDAAGAVLDRLARYGGSCVVLIHPDVFDDKLEFLKGFVAAAKAKQVWFGTLSGFGRWWSARDKVGMDVRRSGSGMELDLQFEDAVSGLSVQVPRGWTLVDDGKSDSDVRQSAEQVTLSHGPGRLRLVFEAAR